MKILFYAVFICMIVVLPGSSKGADILYDDFSGTYLDGNRWWPREYVREVADDKLVFKLGNSIGMGAEVRPGRFRNRLPIFDPGSVHTIEAQVTMIEAQRDSAPDSLSFVRIIGYFYNASEIGSAGDIYASVMIGDRGNGGLEAFWVVKEVVANDPWTTKVLDYETLIGPGTLEYDEPYDLKLSFYLTTEKKGQFSFEAHGHTQSSIGPVKKRDVIYDEKRLAVAINAENGFNNGFVHAQVDNVHINNDPLVYDDFSSPLDLSKWKWQEWVRRPVQGELKAAIQRTDATGGANTYTNCPDTSFIETRARISSDSVLSPGAWGVARVWGYYYNATHGPGSGLDYNRFEGDIFAEADIQVDSQGNLKSRAYISRADDEDFSSDTVLLNEDFPTPIRLDTDYVLSIRFEDNQLIFKCDNDTLIFPITGPRYHPYGKYRRAVQTKSFLDSGEYAYMKAFFDDVRVSDNDIEFCLQDYDFDNDMDGHDILAFINDAKGVVLDDFSSHYGRTDCP